MRDIRVVQGWPPVDLAGMRRIGPIRAGERYRYKAWRKADHGSRRVSVAKLSPRRLGRRARYARRSDAPALYFAYGSNLDLAQMRRRCPAAVPVRGYRLAGWRLRFGTFADIVPDPASYVEGALYRTTRRCVRALDRYEGVRVGSYRRVAMRLPPTGEIAFVYLRNGNRISPPDDDYLQTIINGYDDWGIPFATLGAAVRMAYDGQGLAVV